MGPVVNLAEAVRGGWVELWSQPKIDARTITLRGVEGLLRLRHPARGLLPPGYFPKDALNSCRSVSEAVIARAADDWYLFHGECGALELAINLPIDFWQEPDAIAHLCRGIPEHDAFQGLLVEIDCIDILANLALVRELAHEFRNHKVALSIDDVGAEWSSLVGLADFPCVEIKIDQSWVRGCAGDAAKQAMCSDIVALANFYGARTVAEGVETWPDFLTLRELGIDLVQGFLFAKPLCAEELARSCWTARHALPCSHARSAKQLPQLFNIRERGVRRNDRRIDECHDTETPAAGRHRRSG